MTLPDGWYTLTPRIFVRQPDELVLFPREVFAATGEFTPDRRAEMRIGDSMLMMSGDRDRHHSGILVHVRRRCGCCRHACTGRGSSIARAAGRHAIRRSPWTGPS